VSPPWFYEPHLQVQCAEFPRIELVCKVHSTGRLRPPLLVGNANAGRIMGIPSANSTGTSLRSGTRPAHMRIPSADSIRSPRGAYAPALVAGTTSIRRKKDDFCGAQTHVRKSGGRQPAVVRQTRLRRHEGDCSENRRQYVGRSPLPSRPAIPRGAYAARSRSGMRALRELCAFHLQIRPEHRCVRERAQHTCVFQLWIRSFTTGGLRPPLLVARCRAGAPNAERSEGTADIGESRIGASLIGEWICLPPVALFAC
jgi:hypothetical protein